MNPGCPVKYKVDLTGDPELGIHNPGPFFDYGSVFLWRFNR